jgi:hypothetical protein
MSHGILSTNDIFAAVRDGELLRADADLALEHGTEVGDWNIGLAARQAIIDNAIKDGIDAGTLDSGGLPIGTEGTTGAGTGGTGGGGTGGLGTFTDEELEAARGLLSSDRAGRLGIFQREQDLSPFISPLLREVRQSAFNPLSAAGALQSFTDPNQAFDFQSFIQNQQPGTFNQVGGFDPLIAQAKILFGLQDPNVAQTVGRQRIEQQAPNILQSIGSAGINPAFAQAARDEIKRRIGQLNPIAGANPFQAFLGGTLKF